jgi:ribonuclease PH
MRRHDGRASGELRAISLERHFTKHAEGAVLAAFGETKVLCTATVDESVPPWLRDSKRGWVTAEYAMLPRATSTRVTRDSNTKGRAQEISRLIGRALRCAIDLSLLGPRQIILDCDVLQADGGTRTAAITGAFVALHDALTPMVAAGKLERLPLLGQCAAVSLGIVHEEILLDLDYSEDFAADVDLNLVMLDNGRIVEVQASAEGRPFTSAQLQRMLDLGAQGIDSLFALQREAFARNGH